MIETEAKAATIVLNLVVFGAALPSGLYYFLRSGLSLSRLRELVAEEEREAEAEAEATAAKLRREEGGGAGVAAGA